MITAGYIGDIISAAENDGDYAGIADVLGGGATVSYLAQAAALAQGTVNAIDSQKGSAATQAVFKSTTVSSSEGGQTWAQIWGNYSLGKKIAILFIPFVLSVWILWRIVKFVFKKRR